MFKNRIDKYLVKGPATRNAIFATLKAIVDDEKSSTISLRVAWPLGRLHIE